MQLRTLVNLIMRLCEGMANLEGYKKRFLSQVFQVSRDVRQMGSDIGSGFTAIQANFKVFKDRT